MEYKEKRVPEKTDKYGLPETIDKRRRRPRLSFLKWFLFLVFIFYFIVSSYRVPLLVKMGEYLVVEHEQRKADLIVCVAGEDTDRAPAAVDVYRQGLAPYIFRAKEVQPDGFDYVKGKVASYPAKFDLFMQISEGFGVPREAILSSDERVGSTIEEARLVHKLMIEREFKSVIIVTSPPHSRRAWLTFKKVFKNDEIITTSLPSRYQAFDPKDWWTKRKYFKEVVFEYQKLIYYKFAYGI